MTNKQWVVIGVTLFLSWAIWVDFLEFGFYFRPGRELEIERQLLEDLLGSDDHAAAVFVAIGGALVVWFMQTRRPPR